MKASKLAREYYNLTKPGIIRGNLMTAAAAFLLASRGYPDPLLLLAMLAGLALVIGSGCVSNNYIDRGIDRKMARTRQRALASGVISGRSAINYAAVLLAAGLVILVIFTNILTALLSLACFVAYVFIYAIAKRKSVYGTEVGSISGAIPPVVGYCAVTGSLDITALLLFIVLVVWQMPHFYAIAIFRKEDYKAAGIPVLPLVRGIPATKRRMVWYAAAFLAAVIALGIHDGLSPAYYVITGGAGVYWLACGVKGLRPADDAHDIRWARKMFGVSLLALTAFSVTLAIEGFLPI
ncbi:MAG TPA: heme o synthase [Candidatus Saccharimonadales bacterium]|jgi:protoheme IX farnesyltransferase